MNPLIEAFKDCAHQAGEVCSFSLGKILRDFGLKDFLENVLEDDDDASTIAVEALKFFCKDQTPHQDQFKFAVLSVGIFLNENTKRRGIPQQALRDLVAILNKGIDEAHILRWIASNF